MARIPKIIHYCWVGGNPLPPLAIKCIESWKKHCPDYEIKEWNETNYDISKNKYMYQAYQNKAWGFVPDYARLDIIYEYGGIYLDADVEIVKSFDTLLDNKAFAGFEGNKYVNFGQGFGAEKGSNIIKSLRDDYNNIDFISKNGNLNRIASPVYQTKYLKDCGLVINNTKQTIEGLTIYPKEWFNPLDGITEKIEITQNTYSIHHFAGSWMTEDEKKEYKILTGYRRRYGKRFGEILYALTALCTFRRSGINNIIKYIKNK